MGGKTTDEILTELKKVRLQVSKEPDNIYAETWVRVLEWVLDI